MKEYLSKDYCVQSISDINTLCEIPEGAECLTKYGLEFVFWKDGGKFSWHTENSTEWDNNIELELTTLSDYGKEYIVWERKVHQIEDNSIVNSEFFPGKKHSHYFKDVSNLLELDVYRVLKLFDVTDPCIQHAVKKLLCAGGRGVKDVDKDVHEAIDSLLRYEEMRKEDEVNS